MVFIVHDTAAEDKGRMPFVPRESKTGTSLPCSMDWVFGIFIPPLGEGQPEAVCMMQSTSSQYEHAGVAVIFSS